MIDLIGRGDKCRILEREIFIILMIFKKGDITEYWLLKVLSFFCFFYDRWRPKRKRLPRNLEREKGAAFHVAYIIPP